MDVAAVLRAEMEMRYGQVALSLETPERETPTFSISKTEFLLKLPSGLKFHYRRGEGVIIQRPDSVPDADVDVFLNGSVFGAIAWLNGIVPLHASAIVHDDAVYAFTGPSGAGKSTLAAALGNEGFALLTDDVLLLDFSDPDHILCLPWRKKLKLWDDALCLTGATALDRVRPQLQKYYASAPGGTSDEQLPLKRIHFLTALGNKPALTEIRGYERFLHAQSAFYRPGFCGAVTEKRDLFSIAKRLSESVQILTFDRPMQKDDFAEGIGFIADAIRSSDRP